MRNVVSGLRRYPVESMGGEDLARAPRCRTIDVRQDGAGADGGWLKPLTAEREMLVAMYASVVTPGRIARGDEVQP